MYWLIKLPILLFSVILHECAHGWMAEKRGDNTARIMGRLTLNPLPHIDLVGTIILPLLGLISGGIIFGWAKPVPVDPYRLNNPERDLVYVSLAGPGSNILLAITASLLLMVFRVLGFTSGIMGFSLEYFLNYVMFINILLSVFNMFPIPPLDGSKVLMNFLPPKLAYEYRKIERHGFLILMILMIGTITQVTMIQPMKQNHNEFPTEYLSTSNERKYYT